MKYYRTKDGFVVVPNYHADYFEKKFDFIDCFEISVATMQTLRLTVEPYEAISKRVFLAWLREVISDYEFRVEKYKLLLKLLEDEK